ncbi:MAG: WD40 repeat domain-containing protein [Solirubrobacteraceae bacterium]
MTETELRERLRAAPVPIEPAAEERGWQTVSRAYRAPAVGRRPRVRRRVLVPALAALIAVVAVALAAGSAPRAALARWFRDAFGLTAQPRPRPVLAGLPSGGRLLVNAPSGAWIVGASGVRTHLGVFSGAAWSPHSLYVVAWRGDRLAALDPHGQRQWTLGTGGPVAAVRWSPDGYRIAYLAGGGLDVVAGDGSGNRRLVARVRPVGAAWQPGEGVAHRLALVGQRGNLELRDADTGALLWRVRPPAAPEQLLWSSTGHRLLVISRRAITVYSARGHRLAALTLAPGVRSGAAALGPGDRLALVIHRPAGQPDSIELFTATAGGVRRPPRIVFTAAERLAGLAWSPDARWLLAGSSSADQWIFLRVAAPARISVVSQIATKFSLGARRAPGFPTLGGWQP